MFKVFKFGGASIKDVNSIKNVGEILQSYKDYDLVVVFSAIGKVTNMLEVVVEQYVKKTAKANDALQKVKDFHSDILVDLFDKDHAIYNEVNNLFVEIEWVLEDDPNQEYAYDYDRERSHRGQGAVVERLPALGVSGRAASLEGRPRALRERPQGPRPLLAAANARRAPAPERAGPRAARRRRDHGAGRPVRARLPHADGGPRGH